MNDSDQVPLHGFSGWKRIRMLFMQNMKSLSTKVSSVSRGYLGGVLLTIGSLAVLFALIEAMLALVLPVPIQWREPQELYNADAILGHRLMPRQKSFTHSYPVITNSFGFRDREIPVGRKPGVTRIFCLGDSLTFGDGVAAEDTYPKQLEGILNGEGVLRYEVINAGVPSYDTWQEVMFYQARGVEFSPDVVLLGFYLNDVVPRPQAVRPLLSENGTLRRQGFGSLFPDEVAHILKKSRLLLFLKDRVSKLINQISPSSEYLHQRSLLEGVPNEFVERGWLEVDASLAKMKELQQQHKFHFVIVIFPMAEQLMHEYPNAQYPARLKQIAEKYHVDYLDLQPSFARQFKGFGSLFIEWDGHPNGRAHRIAAEEISVFLRRTP